MSFPLPVEEIVFQFLFHLDNKGGSFGKRMFCLNSECATLMISWKQNPLFR